MAISRLPCTDKGTKHVVHRMKRNGEEKERAKKNGPIGEMSLASLCGAIYKEGVTTVRPRDMPSLGVSSLDLGRS